MARDKFCGVDYYTDEWTPKVASRLQWHGHAGRAAIGRLLDEMWQRPDPTPDSAVIAEERPLAERFLEQAEKWDRETGHLSSPTQRIMHPSYQAILGMGREHREEVIRLLLLDLQKNRRPWFWALSFLAQDNPVRAEEAGKIDKMIEAWVKWGKSRGLI